MRKSGSPSVIAGLDPKRSRGGGAGSDMNGGVGSDSNQGEGEWGGIRPKWQGGIISEWGSTPKLEGGKQGQTQTRG